MVYGTLFALCNRIQTIGDSQMEGMTMKQHFLLICISVFQTPPSLRETAEFMGCTYQNVKRMALVLEKNGYLVIETDPADHRRQKLVVTEKVKSFVQMIDKNSKNFMEQMFLGISHSDIATTLATLTAMENNLKENLNENNRSVSV